MHRAEIEGTGKNIKTYLKEIKSEIKNDHNYRMLFKLVDPSKDRDE